MLRSFCHLQWGNWFLSQSPEHTILVMVKLIKGLIMSGSTTQALRERALQICSAYKCQSTHLKTMVTPTFGPPVSSELPFSSSPAALVSLEGKGAFIGTNIQNHIFPGVKHGVVQASKFDKFQGCIDTTALILTHLHSLANNSVVEASVQEHEVVIALGSNMGNRVHNLNEALRLLRNSGVKIMRHGCLYETEPAYVPDQPLFLNSAVRAKTSLGPQELLKLLKKIEKDLGRRYAMRYGPRLIDLDILFFGNLRIESEVLTVPHERMWERPFVMAPLVDLLGSSIDNVSASWHSLSGNAGGIFEAWDKLGGESLIGGKSIKRVIPLGEQLWDWSQKTHVMGILNLTPDSFSDGSRLQSVDAAVSNVKSLVEDGADMIDIGAQSTRPSATKISAKEELDRLLPVLEAVVKLPEVEGKFISVDTFYSEVAMESVKRGAHLINDVSGGRLDPNMIKVIADLGVPYVIMHMRGDPLTMQNDTNTYYEDVCREVASELYARICDAEVSGIPAWRIMIDPGIGFSKKTSHCLEILMGLPRLLREIVSASYAASHMPILIGPSRKRFLGVISNRPNATERDPATISAVTAGILGGANIVRVHNVRDNLDAARLCDALLNQMKD